MYIYPHDSFFNSLISVAEQGLLLPGASLPPPPFALPLINFSGRAGVTTVRGQIYIGVYLCSRNTFVGEIATPFAPLLINLSNHFRLKMILKY